MDHSLLIFATVAKTRNFSRAAEALHMTQPAVSLQIQALEQKFGVKLLERTNRTVRLTRAGEILLDRAEEILESYRELGLIMDDLVQGEGGHLAIGASYTFGEYVLPRILAQFCKRYPKVSVAITIENTSQVAEAILRREQDVGIVEGGLHHSDLEVLPLFEDELRVVVPASHRLAGRAEATPEELAGERWILREHGSGTREAADKMFSATGLVPAALVELGSTQIIKESVEAGLGVSLLSTWTVVKEIRLGTLKTLRLHEFPILRTFSAVLHRTRYHIRAVDHFIAVLREESETIRRFGTSRWENEIQEGGCTPIMKRAGIEKEARPGPNDGQGG
ncbi:MULTISPECIES: LysR family transcriptional regulator [Kyrpidia]|uniref:LysR family transcriptional regulator n=2 Tax=Kyrpidia spormannii TaxID=2055160 RepID=A0A6F9ECU2_9BACL|nr:MULTISPECIES: LysR family transcriptional regulator [Kyrpidia]MCL6575395.1 LysR family transcriptional regulator [Kyrpidia sp.]CAB3393453.1 LysR family transcriptional regulator [Kyrpidia spormannii]CAB3394374.1 LysR family transcriptional regulator [Kyrpidia spormannii]HHY67231.1 LysR family transcriptional regulator [Alicyclobacillus sp.]